MGFSLATDSLQAQARTNIALFLGDIQNYNRVYVTDVKLLQGIAGGEMNAGILVNYSTSNPSSPRYHVALLDLAASSFGFYYFNGLQFVPVGAVASIPELRVGDWYRIGLYVKPAQQYVTQLQVMAVVFGISNTSVNTTITTNVGANMWDFSSAAAGLYTRRSRARFSFWHVDFI